VFLGSLDFVMQHSGSKSKCQFKIKLVLLIKNSLKIRKIEDKGLFIENEMEERNNVDIAFKKVCFK